MMVRTTFERTGAETRHDGATSRSCSKIAARIGDVICRGTRNC